MRLSVNTGFTWNESKPSPPTHFRLIFLKSFASSTAGVRDEEMKAILASVEKLRPAFMIITFGYAR
jgi:hypothetical protein